MLRISSDRFATLIIHVLFRGLPSYYGRIIVNFDALPPNMNVDVLVRAPGHEAYQALRAMHEKEDNQGKLRRRFNMPSILINAEHSTWKSLSNKLLGA